MTTLTKLCTALWTASACQRDRERLLGARNAASTICFPTEPSDIKDLTTNDFKDTAKGRHLLGACKGEDCTFVFVGSGRYA